MAQVADIAQPAINGLQALIDDPELISAGKVLAGMSPASQGRLKPELKERLKAYENVVRALAMAQEYAEKNK